MTIDRRLTLGVLLTVIVQTAGVLVWAGAAAQRLDAVEQQVAAHEGAGERLARLEAEIASIRQQLDRIEDRLERAHGR